MEKQKLSESPKIRLSVALATYNEGRCLSDCLESVKDIADEIVIVDGSSTDNTVEIAKKYEAKIIITTNKPLFHLNKQKAIDECKGEWILQLDADEIIPPELAQEVISVTQHLSPDTHDAFWIKRKKIFLGKWMKKGGQYPDPVIRLFKKGKACLPCESVHEQIKAEGETGWLENPLIHLTTPSFAVYLTKDNRYSTLTALEFKKKNLPLNFISAFKYLFWEPNAIFFRLYFRHLGFLDGFPGFVFALYSGLHIASAFVKYWEMKTSGGINVENDWV